MTGRPNRHPACGESARQEGGRRDSSSRPLRIRHFRCGESRAAGSVGEGTVICTVSWPKIFWSLNQSPPFITQWLTIVWPQVVEANVVPLLAVTFGTSSNQGQVVKVAEVTDVTISRLRAARG